MVEIRVCGRLAYGALHFSTYPRAVVDQLRSNTARKHATPCPGSTYTPNLKPQLQNGGRVHPRQTVPPIASPAIELPTQPIVHTRTRLPPHNQKDVLCITFLDNSIRLYFHVEQLRSSSTAEKWVVQVSTSHPGTGMADPATDTKDVAAALVSEYAGTWDREVERRVVRKIDLVVVPFLWVGYGLVYYDKVGDLFFRSRGTGSCLTTRDRMC